MPAKKNTATKPNKGARSRLLAGLARIDAVLDDIHSRCMRIEETARETSAETQRSTT